MKQINFLPFKKLKITVFIITRMESSDIMSDLINENQIDSEKITAEMELLDKLALNEENEENEELSPTDNLDQEETSKDQTELVGENELEDKITRPCQFALHRIKTIMKYDPDLALASKESVFAIAKATVS